MSNPTLLSGGYALSDVAAVIITTPSKSYMIKTGNEASGKPAVDSGTEKVLRKGNTTLALNKTDDLAKGTDIELTDLLMHPEAYALVDGGTVTNAAEGAFEKYAAPVAGSPVTRTEFTLNIYCADLDTSGNAIGYMMISYPNCKGTPCEFSTKDGDFYSPKYTIQSRPKKGISMYEMAYVDTLPVAEA